MKQTFLLAASTILLASCNNNGDADMYKKKADSLSVELAKLQPAGKPADSTVAMKTTDNFATTAAADSGSNTITYRLGHNKYNDAAAMTVTDANTIIQAWHGYAKNKLPAAAMKSLSFVVDAQVLKNSVLKQSNVTNVVFYIAMNTDSTLTLVYVPAIPDTANANKLTEMPFIFSGSSTLQTFDHSFPCPTCDKIGVHPGKPTGE